MILADEDFYPETPDEPAFTTEERVLTYQGDWSIRLTEKELNAYRIQVIVAPTYIPFRPYENLGYNPPQSVFLRGTAWSQDVGITRKFLVEWRSQIVMDYRNEGALTRWWTTVLFWWRMKREALASLLIAEQLAAIPGLSFPIYEARAPILNVEWQAYVMDSGIPEGQVQDGTPILPVLGFAPPETLWKFVAEQPGIWSQVTVKTWYLPPIPSLPIAEPSANEEEPNSNADGQPPTDVPTPGQPPDPSDESPYDPRNGANDYSTAPPPEEDEDEDPVLIFITIVGEYGTETPQGTRIANPQGQATVCGEAVSAPAPQIKTTNEYQNQPGNVGWVLEFTNQQGVRIKRFLGDGSFDRTPYGSPTLEITPC